MLTILLSFLFLVISTVGADSVLRYNASNIQLQRVLIVPTFEADTHLTMSCEDVQSFEFCGVQLRFFCSGFLSNANITSNMGLYITADNAVTELHENPAWKITTSCGGNRVYASGPVILSGKFNQLSSYEKICQWVDYCGTFNITMFYVETTVENQVYPTEIIYLNTTGSASDNTRCFETTGPCGIDGGDIFLIVAVAVLGLLVLILSVLLLFKNHQLTRFCPRFLLKRFSSGNKSVNSDESEQAYLEISRRTEENVLSRDVRCLTDREGNKSEIKSRRLTVDSGVCSLRPSPIGGSTTGRCPEFFSFPRSKTSSIQNELYLQSGGSVPLRLPSRLSIDSLSADEIQLPRGKRLSIPLHEDSTAARAEKSIRFIGRCQSEREERRDRLSSLGSIQEL